MYTCHFWITCESFYHLALNTRNECSHNTASSSLLSVRRNPVYVTIAERTDKVRCITVALNLAYLYFMFPSHFLFTLYVHVIKLKRRDILKIKEVKTFISTGI